MIKLKEAVLTRFGKFKNETVKFSDGFQVIYGLNESGKSTLQLFLRVMLYGMPTQRRAGRTIIDRDKAIPWHEKTAEGILRLEADGRKIEIHRCFGKTAAGDKIETIDALSGEPIRELCSADVGAKLLNMSENIFEKTLWVRQGSVFPTGKDEEISKKLMNLCDTGDEEVSAERTMKNIDAKIKSIRAKDKRGTPGSLDVLRREKEEKNEERYRLVSMIRQRAAAEKKLSILKEKLAETDKKTERLAAEEQVRMELIALEEKSKKWNRAESLREKIDELKADEKFEKYKSIQADDVAEAEKSENRLNSIDQSEIKSYDINESDCRISGRGKLISVFGCAVTAAAVLISVLNPSAMPLGLVLAAVGISAAIIGAVVYKNDRRVYSENIKRVNELKNRTAETEKEKSEIKNGIDVILKRFGCADVGELKRSYLYCCDIRTESEKLICAYNAVTDGENLDDLKAAHDRLAAADTSITGRDIAAEIKQQRELQKRLQQEIAELSRASGYVPGEFKNPAELDAEIAMIDEDIKKQETILKAAEMAEKVFKEVYERRRSDFTPMLNKKVKEYLKLLTNGRYSDIRISDEYSARISPDGGSVYDSGYFSCGTCDQVYLALRLAVGILAGDGNEPIFIDDMLTAYDDERAAAATELLSKMSEERQVIMFTCHRRDKENAEQLGAVIKELEEEYVNGC